MSEGDGLDAGLRGARSTDCRGLSEACSGVAGMGALADGAENLAGEKGTLIRK